MNVVFVCTGNTCRSPMAEALMKLRLEQLDRIRPDETITSAGIHAWPGQDAAEQARAVLANEYGADISGHRSQLLDQALMDAADRILCMTGRHKQILLHEYPMHAAKIMTLGEAAGEAAVDVHDPYGGSYASYRDTAAQIDELIQKFLKETGTTLFPV